MGQRTWTKPPNADFWTPEAMQKREEQWRKQIQEDLAKQKSADVLAHEKAPTFENFISSDKGLTDGQENA
jgi:hypothetical protein